MELRLLTATFKFKDIHLNYAKKSGVKEASVANRDSTSEREINLSRSHFLEPTQG